MDGFSNEMQGRIHGILSDLVFESHNLDGFPDAERHMAKIRAVAGPYIEGMTPTVVVPSMLVFQVNGNWNTHQVNMVGIDRQTHAKVSDFGKFLQHPANREQLSFDLRERGYDTLDHQLGDKAKPRERMQYAGWDYRRAWARYQAEMQAHQAADAQMQGEGQPPAAQVSDPFPLAEAPVAEEFDPGKEQHTGLVMGIALASFRVHDGTDRFLVLPGDDVKVTLPTAGVPPKAASDNFTIVDFYESKMSEYDANMVFVPIEKLQRMRGMFDEATGIGNVTHIQIKLRAGADGSMVRDKLRAAFPAEMYGIYTWRDKQGPLLAAVNLETAILNVLLFMIIAVAGFGILAIFFMIVVEKTKDIGVLKSLGAPSRGIMGIFLSYGLSLGIVGSGVGMVIGLAFVANINEIADALAWVTGHEVFDPTIYYFQEIPAIVKPFTVFWIVVGAMLIAVVASVLPARRAARLHPVEALRHQ
jgi:lipoprotein-releasing system permease protein